MAPPSSRQVCIDVAVPCSQQRPRSCIIEARTELQIGQGTMPAFYFEREVRTANSECYAILEEGKPIGRLDLHFAHHMVHGTLIVDESVTQEGIQELVTIVDEDIIDAVGVERDDFVVHVHQGRDLGVYANNEFGPSHSEEDGGAGA